MINPTPIDPASITVASVPTGHTYVAHLGSDGVRRLPDPVPPGAEGTGRWWPPRWLEPEWTKRNLSSFDVLHVHFGFDSLPPEQLGEVIRTVQSAGKPLVYTVHDLHNPHFVDNSLHEAHLDMLIEAAAEVITLTPGAAREIESRWERRATVVPHPHVAPMELIGQRRTNTESFVIGVHAKSLRTNLDPLAVLGTIVDTAAQLPGATVRIDIDEQAFDSHPEDAAAIAAFGTHEGVDVRVHPRFDDDELWTYLTEIDVSVLPYRFGTHSGWLEACVDLGTAVVVPDCGYFAEQTPCRVFGFGLGRFDDSSLADALRSTYDDVLTQRSTQSGAGEFLRTSREVDKEEAARTHARVYRRAVAGRRLTTGTPR
ncbi:glycosyltransferase [Rhodococcoides fascians]|uniref:glycosyltransferase n=1 Tax=Rhodococcoides fascians TaxID=1828 RepID=UPI0005699485|nr:MULTISPECIES: glycosyltransferase [Rhodococcus]OZF06280.1 hypothetical protein CH301_01775 [Rhodococcus sp. 15-1189-1-1a]OZF21048.1 hypothetical protein CH299_02160 [Rhodococcus sp. 14-2686-1-2]